MNKTSSYLIRALEAHYEAQIHKHEALLFNYIENSAGIGEHPDIVEECIKSIDAITHNSDALETIINIKRKIGTTINFLDEVDEHHPIIY